MIACAAALVAALHPSAAHIVTEMRCAKASILPCLRMEADGLEEIVAQQAAQITELRRMVADLQNDGGDRASTQVANQDGGRPRKPIPGKRTTSSKAPTYTLYGKLPPDFEFAPTVEQLIARRVKARLKRHYSEADRLQKRILRMGVRLDDRRKTWSLRRDWRESLQEVQEEDQQSWRRQQELQRELEQRIRKLFEYWDQDGNGLIDRSEFQLAMKVLDIPGTEAEHDAVFDAWDEDKNGGLNFREIRMALVAMQKSGAELPLLGL